MPNRLCQLAHFVTYTVAFPLIPCLRSSCAVVAALVELARQAPRTQQQERQRQAAERHQLQQEREQEERAAAVLEQLSDAQREAYRHRARERLPALMRDMDGVVAMHMRYLVVEDGLVG